MACRHRRDEWEQQQQPDMTGQATADVTMESAEEERGQKRSRPSEMEEEMFQEEEEQRLGSSDVLQMIAAEIQMLNDTGPPWYDDLTGEELNPKQVAAGMVKERASFAAQQAYEEKPEEEAAGQKVISSRWVLVQKTETEVRARLVAREINDGSKQDTFAATPSWVGLMVVIYMALLMCWSLKPGDVSGAFLHALIPQDERVWIRPPTTERRPGDLW